MTRRKWNPNPSRCFVCRRDFNEGEERKDYGIGWCHTGDCEDAHRRCFRAACIEVAGEDPWEGEI